MLVDWHLFVGKSLVHHALATDVQRGGGLAKWRGEHYRSLEPQTVNSPRKVLRSYTPLRQTLLAAVIFI